MSTSTAMPERPLRSSGTVGNRLKEKKGDGLLIALFYVQDV